MADDAERDDADIGPASLATELRDAIEAGELTVVYQPKADVASRQIVGVQALVRWTHPRFGSLPPDEFIPLAEQSGLIRPLTDLVLEQALGQCRSWCKLGFDLSVAVTLSALSLKDDDLPRAIAGALDRNDVAPALLTGEITQSAGRGRPPLAVGPIQALAALGIRLSLDGFGRSASLSYLVDAPFHEVTIDKSFVLIMTVDPDAAAIVRSVISMARQLGLDAVAKGVEDAASLSMLTELGCTVVQGYHLSRPLLAPALTEALQANGIDLHRWMPS